MLNNERETFKVRSALLKIPADNFFMPSNSTQLQFSVPLITKNMVNLNINAGPNEQHPSNASPNTPSTTAWFGLMEVSPGYLVGFLLDIAGLYC